MIITFRRHFSVQSGRELPVRNPRANLAPPLKDLSSSEASLIKAVLGFFLILAFHCRLGDGGAWALPRSAFRDDRTAAKASGSLWLLWHCGQWTANGSRHSGPRDHGGLGSPARRGCSVRRKSAGSLQGDGVSTANEPILAGYNTAR